MVYVLVMYTLCKEEKNGYVKVLGRRFSDERDAHEAKEDFERALSLAEIDLADVEVTIEKE